MLERKIVQEMNFSEMISSFYCKHIYMLERSITLPTKLA